LRRHAVEALIAVAGAVLITVLIAAPVVNAPSERLFGAEIVGRHHDPFTVMRQFSTPWSLGIYWQPYLLARHLALARGGALLAALLFAFSPFHIAHAAYHPHVAQTQWLPLYLLALWRCMDDATWLAMTALAAATAAVTLSNFYGGLIAAVITPVAIGAYWIARQPPPARASRHALAAMGSLAAFALVGVAFVAWRAPHILDDRIALAFPREDPFTYAAKWWSYLVPAVAHPMMGTGARRLWIAEQVSDGLLEQQVSLGWSVIVLGLIAIGAWLSAIVRRQGSRSFQAVPLLVPIALAALICSLSPGRTVFGMTIYRPSALLYLVVPIFRAYARFGVVVQLMAALLAGIGATYLVARRTRTSRILAVALVVLAGAEYAVWPPALSRDVLPTAAHRWTMRQPAGLRVFDCEPLTGESSSIEWLTAGRVALARDGAADCAEPQFAAALQAVGFTHVLLRETWERQWLRDHADAAGVRIDASFADADVFAIRAAAPVYTQTIAGFWPREHGDGTTWRWMSGDAVWTIVAPAPQPRAVLHIGLAAFAFTRRLEVGLDGAPVQTLQVDPRLRTYRIGPLALTAGSHQLTFHAVAPASVVADVIGPGGDRRALSISAGEWRWIE
jgi:hypothetical protein